MKANKAQFIRTAYRINIFVLKYINVKEFSTFKHVLSTWNPNMGPMGGMAYVYPRYINFVQAFKKLNQEINRDKVYNEKELSVYIFTLNFNDVNLHWAKEYFKRKIYVANSYIENITSKFDGNTIHKYLPQLRILCQDLDMLFDEIYTNKIIKEVTKYQRTSFRWRRKFPFRIYEDAYSFLNIKDFESIEQLHFNELEQYSIFAMRQLIEETGKSLLGLLALRDKNNNPNKDTEVTWNFIERELEMAEPRIQIPFDMSIILTIKSWCNNFIHTTEISPIYIMVTTYLAVPNNNLVISLLYLFLALIQFF